MGLILINFPDHLPSSYLIFLTICVVFLILIFPAPPLSTIPLQNCSIPRTVVPLVKKLVKKRMKVVTATAGVTVPVGS